MLIEESIAVKRRSSILGFKPLKDDEFNVNILYELNSDGDDNAMRIELEQVGERLFAFLICQSFIRFDAYQHELSIYTSSIFLGPLSNTLKGI